MTVVSPRTLFMTTLREHYDTEQQLAALLVAIMNAVPDAPVITLCQQSLQMTMMHLHNLDRCFAHMGSSPARTPQPAIAALLHLRSVLVRMHPTPQNGRDIDIDLLATMTTVMAATYQRSIALGTPESFHPCIILLQENLEHTIAMTHQIERLQQGVEHAETATYPCVIGI